MECKEGFDVWSILAGKQRACMNSLALRKSVRVLLIAGLRGSKPLDCGTVFGRLHVDVYGDFAVSGMLVADLDGERSAVWLRPFGGQAEVSFEARDRDTLDIQIARVEQDLGLILEAL